MKRLNVFWMKIWLAWNGFAQEVLEGGLRGVVATMTVEQLVKNRADFGSKVQETVTGDLLRLGLVVDNFLIQDISDEEGYIDALGPYTDG